MRYISALILLTTAVITGVGGASISRVEEPMIIRTPHQQHSLQLRARSNIQQQPSLIPLQRNLQNTIEFCGKCTWSGKISCEARAQFLVKEGRFTTLQDARVSILDSCKPDGSDKAKAPLDAFCASCPYLETNFNCNSRVQYLMGTYFLSEEKAKEATMELGACIDPEYVPPSNNDNDTENSDELSTGSIIGIVIGITLFLMLLIILWATWRWRKKELEKEERFAESEQARQNTPKAKAKAERKRVLEEANKQLAEAENGEGGDGDGDGDGDGESAPIAEVVKTTQETPKKKSINFSPPVVWDIDDDGKDRPDPPTAAEHNNKENGAAAATQDSGRKHSDPPPDEKTNEGKYSSFMEFMTKPVDNDNNDSSDSPMLQRLSSTMAVDGAEEETEASETNKSSTTSPMRNTRSEQQPIDSASSVNSGSKASIRDRLSRLSSTGGAEEETAAASSKVSHPADPSVNSNGGGESKADSSKAASANSADMYMADDVSEISMSVKGLGLEP